ncbi:MAG: hypothetical protein ACREM1_21150 [Longimicrobiales bacterium]
MPEIYVNGFLPEIHTEMIDRALTAGVRGTASGWDLDLSVTNGASGFQFNIEDSNNASLGPSSPTTFDAGRLHFAETVGSFDAVRLIDTNGALRSLSFVDWRGVPDRELPHRRRRGRVLAAGQRGDTLDNLSVTADFYHVTIDDRSVLTSLFRNSDPIAARILEPFAREGVGAAQFFTNAVDTRTNGVDIVAAYETPAGEGTLTFQGALNLTNTEVERINVSQDVADTFAGGDLDAVRNTIFNREERNRLEDALPREKGNVSARYAMGRLTVGGRASYFGSTEYKPSGDPPFPNDETFGAKVCSIWTSATTYGRVCDCPWAGTTS